MTKREQMVAELDEYFEEILTDEALPTNILIEGDNYHALCVLNYTHKGKIDLIYIDPPYNTKSSFDHYSDNLEHSKWLNMMKERLKYNLQVEIK